MLPPYRAIRTDRAIYFTYFSYRTLEIARAMDFSGVESRNLARGAYLHDIGKLGIPDGILLKAGPLTADEWKVMKEHVQIGFNLVRGIPFLAEAAEMILTHHERCDGSGYPHGLKAEQIPPAARIFAVADTLDAITSDRPYRRASPFQKGLDIISREAGRLFDPQVVNAFIHIPAETWPMIARQKSTGCELTRC
ncbi:MAG TPA: HD-GYP domain-containing protein [Candidatus Dormibacteraeota bacterium]|nr:HD-GYP domain-containing protein [Candidatus Dormibacteraeota bacterium]